MLSTTSVTVSSTGTGLQVKAGCRGFEIVFDEPEEAGANRRGAWSPVEGLLCAFGACQSIATLIFSRAQGIDLQGVQMEIEGDLDPDGFMGLDPDRAQRLAGNPLQGASEMRRRGKSARIGTSCRRRCPVGDCLKNPVPVVCTDVAVG